MILCVVVGKGGDDPVLVEVDVDAFSVVEDDDPVVVVVVVVVELSSEVVEVTPSVEAGSFVVEVAFESCPVVDSCPVVESCAVVDEALLAAVVVSFVGCDVVLVVFAVVVVVVVVVVLVVVVVVIDVVEVVITFVALAHAYFEFIQIIYLHPTCVAFTISP